MPTSTPEQTAAPERRTAGIGPSTEGEFHLEAVSVEAAVADVRKRTGRDPEVLDVQKVTKGGVGGFFAKELVRVHVRLGTTARPAPQERVAEARPRGVDGVLQAMANVHDERERDFELELRKALAEGRPTSGDEVRAQQPDAPASPAVPARPALSASPAVPAQPRIIEPLAAPVAEPVQPVRPDHRRAPAVEDSPRSLMDPQVADRLRRPDDADSRLTSSLPRGFRQQPATAANAANAAHVAAHDDRTGEFDYSLSLSDVVDLTNKKLASGSPLAVSRAAEPGQDWSREALYALGLPGSVIDRVDVGPDADEFTWLRAMSEAVAPWCRALPRKAGLLVGPRAAALGEALGLAVCHRSENDVPYGGEAALVTTDSAASRNWIEEVRGERWLHLVVGGRRWKGLVAAGPKAVSVVGRGRIPEALALCVSFDLVLGHHLADTREGAAIRLKPLDVALAVRDALPRVAGA